MGSILFDSRAERSFPFSAGRSARACAGGMGNSQLGPGRSPDQLCRRHGILRGALLVRLGAPRLLPLRGFFSNRADYFDRAAVGDLGRVWAADSHRLRRHRFSFSDHSQHLARLEIHGAVVGRPFQALFGNRPANALDVKNPLRSAANFFRFENRLRAGRGRRHRRRVYRRRRSRQRGRLGAHAAKDRPGFCGGADFFIARHRTCRRGQSRFISFIGFMAYFGKEIFMSIVSFILASILLAFPATAAQSAPVNLQFALNWKAEPEFGGFYAAKLSGYFEKRGINVDITEGGAGTPVVQMVANSKVPFGIAAGDEVAIAQARGADVIALFAVYQINPQGIMVHPERGFKSIADVFNSPGTLAIQNGAPHTLFLQAKFGKAKVKLVPYAGGIATFLTDPSYSQQCFVTSEPLLAKKKTVPANSFLIADEGFKPYGTVVVARRQYVEKNPKQTRNFIDAVREGWQEY